MKRVGIIEDQTSIREMIVEVILDPGTFEVIFSSVDGEEGLQKCIETKPDFLILDAVLPNINGIEVLKAISSKLPETRVLVFSGYQSPQLVRDLLQAGAHGFVEKSAPLSDLRKGVEIVAAGGSYFGPEVAMLLRQAIAEPKPDTSTSGALTKREKEILCLIANSHSTREIANKLEISVKTAENHRTNLMRKLELRDVASLTRYAISKGLISAEH